MNKTKFLLLSFSFLILTLLSSSPARSQDQDSKKITLKAGQTYTVRLESYPATHYEWTFTDPYDTSLVQYKGHSFTPDADTSKPGKPGTDNFTFKALQSGKVLLRFAYKRNWERTVGKIEDYLLIIE